MSVQSRSAKQLCFSLCIFSSSIEDWDTCSPRFVYGFFLAAILLYEQGFWWFFSFVCIDHWTVNIVIIMILVGSFGHYSDTQFTVHITDFVSMNRTFWKIFFFGGGRGGGKKYSWAMNLGPNKRLYK